MDRQSVHPFAECLKDYIEEGKGQEPIAVFTGVSGDEVFGWLSERPKTEQFFKASYFLANEGYRIEEFEALPVEIFNFGKVLLGPLRSFQEIADRYPKVFTNRESVYDMFRRACDAGRRRRQMFADLFEVLKKKYPELETFPIPTDPEHWLEHEQRSASSLSEEIQQPFAQQVKETVPIEKKALLELFSTLAAMGTHVGQIILSDAFTPEERYEFRTKLLAGGKLAKFSDVVSALTSERARTETLQSKQSTKERKPN